MRFEGLTVAVSAGRQAIPYRRSGNRRRTTVLLRQYAPASAHARINAPNCVCVPGAGVRFAPGFQAQPTSVSSDMCLTSAARSMLSLRDLSLICSQICASGLPCQAIDAGARCYRWPARLSSRSSRPGGRWCSAWRAEAVGAAITQGCAALSHRSGSGSNT